MTNLFKKSAIGSAVTLALMGGAAPALAAQGVQFCATGTSCAGMLVTQFAWQQGTTIIDNGFTDAPADALVLGAQLRGQGWLSQLKGSPSDVSNNNFFYVFSIDVAVSKTGNTGADSVDLIDSQVGVPTATTATNYFRMYHMPGFATTANFDAGIGAVPAGASLILEGAVFLDDAPLVFAANKEDTPSSIDIGSIVGTDIGNGSTTQGKNTIRTINTSGGLRLDINVLTAEDEYFRTNIGAMNLDLNLSDSLTNPFGTGVRVPALINGPTLPNFGNPTANVVRNDTLCNGAPPCDMIFASTSSPLSNIFADTNVPEPGTVALLGLGLLGLGRLTSRKRS